MGFIHRIHQISIIAKAQKEGEKDVFICARVGYTRLPMDFGWLVHQMRKLDEIRSQRDENALFNTWHSRPF